MLYRVHLATNGVPIVKNKNQSKKAITNKQTNKQTSKQTNKQTNKQKG